MQNLLESEQEEEEKKKQYRLNTLVQTPILPSGNQTNSWNGDDFYQGASFSPDALCLLTSRCNRILLFNTCLCEPKHSNISGSSTANGGWQPALEYHTGDAVRCVQWYPQMQSNNPASCCFLGVSRDQPVHLYDAYTGQIRATYRPYNSLDELDSPSSLCFVNGGQQLVTGGFRKERELQLFDLNRPGKDALVTLKLGKTRKSTDGQKGLVSTLAYSLYHNLIAAGTYSPGSIYLYDARARFTPMAQMVVHGTCIVGHGKSHSRKRKHFANHNDNHNDNDTVNFSSAKVKWFQSRAIKGVTQVEFSKDDSTSFLYSLSRRSNAVIQWDLRKLPTSTHCPGIASFETDNDTNQRLDFALHQNQLLIGGRDKCLRIHDLQNTSKPVEVLRNGFDHSVNGLSVASLGEKTIVASATGSRCFPAESEYDSDDEEKKEEKEGKALSSSSSSSSSSTLSVLSIHGLSTCHDVQTEDP